MNPNDNITGSDDKMNSEIYRRARLARDPRFDGEFFVAVKTTGIYCRPICPARPPAEKNVLYFDNTAQAAQGGFRPCLRCRPESAPHSPAWRGTSTTVQRALDLIHSGALNSDSLESLANRLGVGERYLRKLFQQEVGVSPLAVAHNQRLLFAKKLLVETDIPMTDVAFSSGFGSVRRFNSALRESFGFTPGDLRAKRKPGDSAADITLQLHYRPPYDWAGVIGFFARHALQGTELVDENSYQRNILIDGLPGRIRVSPIIGRDALQLTLRLPSPGHLMPVVSRVRRMFDLDANPAVIQEALENDKVLAQLVKQMPGIRSPVVWSVYESGVRAIVGQQVSLQAARNVSGRLVAATSEANGAFPSPGAICQLDDSHFPMPTRRRDTLREFCRLSAKLETPMALDAFAELKGIGPWTTAMVAMRGYGDPDIFPMGDLVLIKAYEALKTKTGNGQTLKHNIESWRPWRSYAANLLWRSVST